MRQLVTGLWFISLVAVAAPASTQEFGFQRQSPRFLLASATGTVPLDVERTPVLMQRLALDLRGVSLREALETLATRAGLHLVYNDDVVPIDAPVHLRADDITVAAALTDILLGSGIDVVFRWNGRAALVPRTPGPALQTGTIAGTVMGARAEDEALAPVASAQVTVEGTGLGTLTNNEGRFQIDNVPAGRRSVNVTSVGWRRTTQSVDVAEDETVTVDFTLEVSPSQLDEVVVTVTGEQRRVELGHVVDRINADSVVREAPISTLSELLTGRVSGVQVFQDQGTVGGRVTLQVRGQDTGGGLRNEPIVIVDGVRYAANSSTLGRGGTAIGGEATSPLNDLNPNDIESIEVAKGPSAATLYGTDAANGVIVITTKRGRAGATLWNAYARAAQTSVPARRYPDRYIPYGTTPSGAVTSFCQLRIMASGGCTQDSLVVVPNPLNDPDLTILGKQPVWETGLNVSGGSDDVRYYISGSFQDATGPVQMPPAMVERLEAERGIRLPEEWRKPNTRNNLNLRANVAAQLGAADLTVQAGYIRDATQSFPITNPYAEGVTRGAPEDPYGRNTPEEIFAGQSTERTDRFVGSATAQWRLASWLQARGAVGLDMAARNRYSLIRGGNAPGRGLVRIAGIFDDYNNGIVTDTRSRQVVTTGDLGVGASVRRGRFTFRTSVGTQYVRSLTDVLTSEGSSLPPGGSSVGQAANKSSSQYYEETVTLGGYLEQRVGLNDRLFLTGALRVDGASTFGQNYTATAYPKAGVSWLASAEPFFPRVAGLDELRFRYAYGASGQQPSPRWARPFYGVVDGFVNDTLQDVVGLTALGNPDLRPERVREHEFGADASGLDGRVRLGLTWYRRRTVDQIVSMRLAAGYGSRRTNLGLTTQRGFEAELTANFLDTRLLRLDVTARHAVHRTKLIDSGNPGGSRSEGYPLSAQFLPEISYEDSNGDGLLALSEVQIPPRSEWAYAGVTVPPTSQALTTTLGVLDGRLRVSALLERRAGFIQENRFKNALCLAGCLELLDPSTPLSEQAKAVALGNYRFFERGDYIRLREVTMAADLTPVRAGVIRSRSATVSLSGRNLGLWTRFSGPDVESRFHANTVTSTAGGIPQGRTWTIRFDLGY